MLKKSLLFLVIVVAIGFSSINPTQSPNFYQCGLPQLENCGRPW